jgi:hypothetical protein
MSTERGADLWERRAWLGLVLLLLLHAGLSIHQGWQQHGLPLHHHHRTYTRVIHQLRTITGEDLWLDRLTPAQATAPYPWHPLNRHSEAGWLHDLGDGRLDGFRRDPVGYTNAMPFAFLVPGLVALFLPGHPLLVWLSPLLFLALLLVSLHGIGRRCHGPVAGLLAAAVASGYPAVFGFARTHADVVPNAAAAAFTAWMLLRSEGLRRPGASALAGLGLAAIIYTGENASGTAMAYAIVAPFLLAQLGDAALRARRAPRSLGWRLPGLLALLGLPALAFDWSRTDDIIAYFSTASEGNLGLFQGSGDELGGGLAYATAYLWQLANDLVRPPLLLWGGLGLVLLAFHRRAGRQRLVVLAAFLLPLLAVSLIPRKGNWYLGPAVPMLALITALGLRSISHRRWRGVLSALAGATGIASLVLLSVGPDSLRYSLFGESIGVTRPWGMITDNNLPPTHEQREARRRLGESAWALGDLLDEGLPPAGRRRYLALVMPDGAYGWELNYHLELRRPDLRVMPLLLMEDAPFGDAAFDPTTYDAIACLDRSWELAPCALVLQQKPVARALGRARHRERLRPLIDALLERPGAALPPPEASDQGR